MSAFALVFQVFYVVRATFSEKDPHHHHRLRKWVVSEITSQDGSKGLKKKQLLIAPYIVFVIFSGLTAWVCLLYIYGKFN